MHPTHCRGVSISHSGMKKFRNPIILTVIGIRPWSRTRYWTSQSPQPRWSGKLAFLFQHVFRAEKQWAKETVLESLPSQTSGDVGLEDLRVSITWYRKSRMWGTCSTSCEAILLQRLVSRVRLRNSQNCLKKENPCSMLTGNWGETTACYQYQRCSGGVGLR